MTILTPRSRHPHTEARRRGARRWIHPLLSAAVVLAWLIAAGLGGPLFGRVDEVSSNDRTAYLPESAEATEVNAALPDFLGDDVIPAIVVFRADDAIDEERRADLESALRAATESADIPGSPSPILLSDDGLAAQAFVPINTDAEVADSVSTLSAALGDKAPEGVEAFVTGPAGFTADLAAGFAGIDGLLLGVALLAVLVILVLVYRSALLPLIVLSTSLFALCTALLVVWWLAKAGILLLSGQTQGILFILVIGAATDYALLLVARFRDELRHTPDRREAVGRAIRGSIEPILASGGTVIAGLLCLLLSDLKSNSALGPVAAIGIVFAMLAALTLLPALLFTFGRTAFWPRRPRYEPEHCTDRDAKQRGIWARVAAAIRRRPRAIWITTAIILSVGAIGVTQLDAQGVPQSDLVLGHSEAREGQMALGEHFPGGSGSPAYVLVAEAKMQETADIIVSVPGVESVAVTSADAPSGSAPITADGIDAWGSPGSPVPAPTVATGKVLLQATLADAPDSAAAATAVTTMRSSLEPVGAIVGGATATSVDTDRASVHDRNTIIPVVLIVILLILMMLLRSVLAPILLILTTVLSFGTALGVSALVFTHVFHFPGADPAVPLYGFVFLVALGIDYNIFLMTRVREESTRHGTREGILRGLRMTGGVITSAGLVLAATFAALSVIPILFLVQIAFIVAFGVLLDTFIVRSLLVPALGYDIGRAIWWPSRLGREAPENGKKRP